MSNSYSLITIPCLITIPNCIAHIIPCHSIPIIFQSANVEMQYPHCFEPIYKKLHPIPVLQSHQARQSTSQSSPRCQVRQIIKF